RNFGINAVYVVDFEYNLNSLCGKQADGQFPCNGSSELTSFDGIVEINWIPDCCDNERKRET
ncbi:Uncharacterized protein APZ42_014445, partial [Daphnia magna]